MASHAGVEALAALEQQAALVVARSRVSPSCSAVQIDLEQQRPTPGAGALSRPGSSVHALHVGMRQAGWAGR